MTINEYLIKASQDDARRARERGRLLLEARRAGASRRQRAGPAAVARLLAWLRFRRGSAKDLEPVRAGQGFDTPVPAAISGPARTTRTRS